MASHLEAARGAYLVRPWRTDAPAAGTVVVRGTVTTANLVSILPELDRRGLNVKVVAATSPQLFARQDATYRDAVLSAVDRIDAMVVTNGAYRLMEPWAGGPLAREVSLSADWDDRWRTGGSVEEVADEAHLSAAHILEAIERYVAGRAERRARLAALLGG
jgi:transketolase